MNIKILRLIVLIYCAFSPGKISAQTSKENMSDFMQQAADSIYKQESLPGVFVGILNNGERRFFNAGFADPEKKMPYDSATMFEIGSIMVMLSI